MGLHHRNFPVVVEDFVRFGDSASDLVTINLVLCLLRERLEFAIAVPGLKQLTFYDTIGLELAKRNLESSMTSERLKNSFFAAAGTV